MNLQQCRVYIVQPTLRYLDPDIPHSHDAEVLLLGTAAHESQGLTFIRQLDGGPARGLFQMEPPTAASLWNNYLAYHEALADKIKGLVPARGFNDLPGELYGNLPYQVAMARLRYFDCPEALPSLERDGLDALAGYYARHYYAGPDQDDRRLAFTRDFHTYVSPVL